tara:strand:+ start:3920 stop:6298 length:2379 start_codon:yes stop_codon:yes gene_type:complete
MKNNIKSFIYILIFISLLISSKSIGEEIKFEANSIELIDKDERILAKKNVKIFNKKETIYADEMDYDKLKQIIKAKGNIVVENTDEKIKILSDQIDYDKKSEIIIFYKNVSVELEDKFYFNTNQAIYNKVKDEIAINSPSNFKDNFGNKIKSKNLKFLVGKKLLKIKSVELTDQLKNKYFFENAIIDLNSDQLVADDIKIDFFKETFGNSENDPRLRGNYFYSDNNISLIKKGVFTTCKKKDGEKCPPWQFKAKEIKHDKSKKTLYYKNAWLAVYDKPVFYFPRFFHPDPTVKRQSGFLMPKFESSSSLGDSLTVPYYKVIAQNKDFTLTPKIFNESEILLQNEYRQENKSSSHITDLSLKKGKNNSKSHFFSNTIANLDLSFFENSELEFNIETTSNNNYLKSHKIKSEITNNNSLLNSFLLLKGSKKNLSVEAKVEAYENLTKERSSDAYQFLLPSFELSNNFNNNLTLVSNGYNKNYDTNIFEKVLLNDLKYNSSPRISSKGLVNKFNFLFKNVTTESKNSQEYSNNFRSQNYGSFLYDLSFPMKKKGDNFDSLLSGKASLMYSPNKNKNIKDLDRKVDIKNIFSQNRLSLSDSVEGGQSITLGGEYELSDKQNNSILTAGLASVLRDKNEKKLPTNSTINNKSSDLIGSINFKPNENFDVDYRFSLDNDFSSSNYNLIKTDIKINKFVTTFEFLQEDDEIGTENYYSNEMKLLLNKSNSLKYRTRRNKKTDLTEYYNLIYEYKNDCLTAAIQYNKDYYSDKDLRPNEEIFFTISIVPFSSINSPSKRK